MSQMLVLPHLDVGRGRETITVESGTNVSEMVTLAFPGLADLSKVRVVIGDQVITPGVWHLVRPREGATVIIRVIPGNDTLRSVLTVAVLVAAIAAGQYYAPAIAGFLTPASITGFGAAAATAGTISTVAALTTAGFALAGTLLLNAFVPQATLGDQGAGTSVNGITGLQNTASPGGVIPSILGRHRYAPVYAAPPYTEIIGDDQYVVAAFLFGHGPLNFTNHQLGESDIGNFNDVEIEVIQGLPDDPPLTLYSQQVIEDQLNVLLEYNVNNTRITARDVTESALDFTFPQGLVFFDDKGRAQFSRVTIEINQRRVGDVPFTLVTTLAIDGNKQDLIRRAYRWSHPTRGQYEILVKRTTITGDAETKRIDKCTWSAIRSFRPESPFNYPKPLAMAALRIRASDQLNGIVNNYNAVPNLICKDWDAPTQTWIVRETSNPASLYRHVLQGPANVRPKGDDEIDLVQLTDWHEFCVDKGLYYNRVHDYNATRLDVLRDIAAVGRATPHDDGTKWGVTIDRPQSAYVSAISPRNSWDFQGTTPYALFPDGFRCPFIDATNGWNQTERIVPFPGIDAADVEVTEDQTYAGVTDPAQIWKAARRRQYELIHRPHTYTVSQDFESLVLARGDLAPLNHDVLDRDHVAARVAGISGQTVVLDTAVTMETGRGYALSVRTAAGVSVRRTVVTVEGETASLRVVGDLSDFGEGDLALFGTSLNGPVIDVFVKNIERGENLTAKLTLIDAAPQIDTLTDAEVPPVWDGRIGELIDVSALVPSVPAVTVTDSFLQFDITVMPGTGSVALPANYLVSYRLHGGGAFTSVTISATSPVLHVAGFIVGDTIDVKAQAVSAFGVPSADSAIVLALLHDADTNLPSADNTSRTADIIFLTADHF